MGMTPFEMRKNAREGTMNKGALFWSVAVLFSCCQLAYAIPPPWELEEAKSKADLIVVAEPIEIETVREERRLNRKCVVKIVKAIKASPGASEQALADDSRAEVFFFQPEALKVKGNVHVVQVGGTGYPKPAVGVRALVFLKRLEKSEGYGVVCGNFGYMALKAESKKEWTELSQTIERHRKWSERIKDERARQAMAGYYREAAVFVAETQRRNREKAAKP